MDTVGVDSFNNNEGSEVILCSKIAECQAKRSGSDTYNTVANRNSGLQSGLMRSCISIC